MKLPIKLFMLLAIFSTTASQAALVSVNASADMSSGFSISTSLLPIGTNVTSDVYFDIGPGTINTSTISNESGTFNWIDATYGSQTFNVSDSFISTTHSAGWFILTFNGSGPTIKNIIARNFSIQFNIGTNPFISPGRTTELYDLVLNSSIGRFRVGATQDYSTHYGDLQSNVSGTVNAVPIPGALMLFVSGLAGLFSIGKMRALGSE